MRTELCERKTDVLLTFRLWHSCAETPRLQCVRLRWCPSSVRDYPADRLIGHRHTAGRAHVYRYVAAAVHTRLLALNPCTCPAGLTGFISTGLGTVINLIKPDHGRGNWIGEDISSHAESSDARREAGWMSKIFLQSAIEQDTLQRCREEIRNPGEHPGPGKPNIQEKLLMPAVCFTAFQVNWAAARLLKTLCGGNSLRMNCCRWCCLF